jgi:hypothetical protein
MRPPVNETVVSCASNSSTLARVSRASESALPSASATCAVRDVVSSSLPAVDAPSVELELAEGIEVSAAGRMKRAIIPAAIKTEAAAQTSGNRQ